MDKIKNNHGKLIYIIIHFHHHQDQLEQYYYIVVLNIMKKLFILEKEKIEHLNFKQLIQMNHYLQYKKEILIYLKVML